MRNINRRAFLGIGGSLLLAGAVSAQSGNGKDGGTIGLTQIGRYESGLYDEGGAEIPAYDPITRRLFVVNANLGGLDVIDISDPTNPTEDGTIDDLGGTVNSVDVFEGCVAVAVADDDVDGYGEVVFVDSTDDFTDSAQDEKNRLGVGVLPDMVTFTPDGNAVLTANEAEPADDYSPDPEGSISVIDVSGGVENATQTNVTEAGFADFNDDKQSLIDAGVRIYGPESTVAQDLEPEFIAVAPDSRTAYATLQENNALAIVDIADRTAPEVTDIVPLGYKDHSKRKNGLDAIKDGEVDVDSQPLLGMYQPDSIEAYEMDGETYLVTANEGDAREYEALFEVGILTETDDGFVLAIDDDESETEDVPIADDAYDVETLRELEGLEATAVRGDADGDGEVEQIHTFGGRSFSIWKATSGGVELVFESGDEFEQQIKRLIDTGELPEVAWNTDDDSIEIDDESPASGPEPEGVAVGEIDGRPFAFIGLEEIGGVMMFDLKNPRNPRFVDYLNNRIFDFEELGLIGDDPDLGDALEDGTLSPGEAGDLGPEGLLFIAAADSPNGKPLVVAGHEVSGTTVIYEVGRSGPGKAKGRGEGNGNSA